MAEEILKFRPSKKDRVSEKRREKNAKKKGKETKDSSDYEMRRVKSEEKSDLESGHKEDDSKLRRSKRNKNIEPFPELDPAQKDKKKPPQKKSKSKEKKEKQSEQTNHNLKTETNNHPSISEETPSKELHLSSG